MNEPQQELFLTGSNANWPVQSPEEGLKLEISDLRKRELVLSMK